LLRGMLEAGSIETALGAAGQTFPGVPQVINRKVAIEAIAERDGGQLAADLTALGLERARVSGRVVSGLFPLSALWRLESVSSLRFARLVFCRTRDVSGASQGLVVSQGDRALQADVARATFGVDGTGVKVGILSDSFDLAGTQKAVDQANGDLPPLVTILSEGPRGNDEGRAMGQIVHDVAPGANLAFYSAFNGMNDFAAGILALQAAGCRVIVDDVIYYYEPMFTDGPVAQAVDTVKAAGVAHFSAAGNEGRFGYEDPGGFRPSGFYPRGQPPPGAVDVYDQAHDFNPVAGQPDPFLRITVGPGYTMVVVQWNQPYASAGSAGALTDLDVFAYDNSGNPYTVAGGLDFNIGGEPTELVVIYNGSTGTRNLRLAIVKYIDGRFNPATQVAPGFFKLVFFPQQWWVFAINGYPQNNNKGTLYGHANAKGATAVGAAFYRHTPAFGVVVPQKEPYSAAGPTPIFLTPAGAYLPTPEWREKPEITGPDGVNTTFFIPPNDPEPDGWPNFYGTSASAPHAAGVAALARQKLTLTPDQIKAAMEATAIDMYHPGGFDDDTGYGLLQAPGTLAALFPVGDLNYDGYVDQNDLTIILTAIRGHSTDLQYDLNGDQRVDIADARYLAARFTNPGGVPLVKAMSSRGTIGQGN
jgi:hypothetical protein